MTRFVFYVCMIALLTLPLASGCVMLADVERTEDEIDKLLTQDNIDAAMVCAPRELAELNANLLFARYESEHGRPMPAKVHLELAKEFSKAAWENSRGDHCGIDTDGDGIIDKRDPCPTEPEDFDGDRDDDGCPESDRDGDGLDDPVDSCPDEPEDMDGYLDEDGCPDPDNDGDGVRDDIDKCPMTPEDDDGFQDDDGCPDPDNDGDGIMDPVDKCPNEPEDFDGDKDDDGCPDLYKKIVVTKTRIELKQKVFFKHNKSRIMSKSYELLDEVADVLSKNNALNVRIEGHTDSKASNRYNMKLSQRRANAVKKYLVGAGIEGARLIAKGFGEDVPIDTNDTKEGRARNRRVEFHIIR